MLDHRHLCSACAEDCAEAWIGRVDVDCQTPRLDELNRRDFASISDNAEGSKGQGSSEFESVFHQVSHANRHEVVQATPNSWTRGFTFFARSRYVSSDIQKATTTTDIHAIDRLFHASYQRCAAHALRFTYVHINMRIPLLSHRDREAQRVSPLDSLQVSAVQCLGRSCCVRKTTFNAPDRVC